ncbi:MAG: hypothetical protein V3S11_00955, partial [Elusimicrobiota bacterium]
GLTPAQRSIVGLAKGVLAKRLFRWTNTDFSPPASRFDPDSDQIVTVDDLFKRPNGNNEVGRIGRERRKISQEQMAQIKDGAAFTVPSEDFTGQEHEWKLGGLVQRGRRYIIETRNNHLARAYENIRYRTVDRVTGDTPLSLAETVPNFFKGIYETYGSFAGIPEERSSDYGVEETVQKARDKYVTERLSEENRHWGLLNNEEIRYKAGEVLYDIESAAEQAWSDKVEAETERITKELAAEGLEGEALDKELADRLAKARQTEFQDRIAASESLAKIHPRLPGRLIARVESLSMLGTKRESIRRMINMQMAVTKARLIEKHPIKSKIDRWLEGQISRRRDNLWAKLNGELKAKFPAMLREASLEGEAWLFETGRKFDQEVRPGIVAGMKADPEPRKTFRFRLRIWRKAAWKITQDEDGRYYASEFRTVKMPSDKHFWRVALMPLRFAQIAGETLYHLFVSNLWYGPLGVRSLFSPKAFAYEWYVDSETGKLVAESDRRGTLVSRIRGLWAQRREILRDHEQKDSYGFFGKGVERAFLFFTADLGLGVLAPLLVLIGQPILTALNFALAGALLTGAAIVAVDLPLMIMGSLPIILPQALAVLGLSQLVFAWSFSLPVLTSVFAAVMIIANPLAVAVLGSAGRWLFDGLIFDTTGTKHHGIWTRLFPWFYTLGIKTVISGVVLTIASIIAAVIVHPLLALGETLWAGLRAGTRTVYDKGMRGLVRKFARVPGRDSRFLVRRVRGPGLSNEFFFQIERALALVALWAGLERGVHSSYKSRTQEKIRRPRSLYNSIMEALSVLFGTMRPPSDAPGLDQINVSEEKLLEGLAEAAQPNDELYSRLLEIGMTGSIKQTLAELEETVKKSAVITKDFYTKVFADRSAADVAEFWKARSLKQDDWVGLAKTELGSIFGREFLSALETTDKTLVIKVKAPSLGDYAAGLEEGILPEELENIEVGDLGQPASGKEQVRSPIPYIGGDNLTRGGGI